jgi:RNA polymerase sigma-70 factor (ECF subfamily)
MCQTDEECVRRCLDGRPEAFRRLVLRYQGPLTRHLAGRLGNEAAAIEAAQETLVRAYFALPKLRKHDSFHSWLLGIATRVAKETRHASRRRRRLESLDESVLSEDGGTTGSGDDSRATAISQAIGRLPEVYRQVILMRFYEGLSCAQISSDLDAPLGTVTKRLSRAYGLLRESLRTRQREEDGEF